jgi:nicotinamidase-related amidase
MSDELGREFRESGLTRKMGFGKRPAVLVVDFMRAFTNPALPLGSDLDGPVAQTARLLEAARERDLPILFTSIAYDDADLADAGVWGIKVPASGTLRTGTPEVELDPRLERRSSEGLVWKKYASGFFGTDLATRLTAAGVDTLLLAGCTTSGCVRATAVDGLQHGFRVMVIREGVGDRAQPAHEQSLSDMDAKYADVVSIDEVVDYVEGLWSGVAAKGNDD